MPNGNILGNILCSDGLLPNFIILTNTNNTDTFSFVVGHGYYHNAIARGNSAVDIRSLTIL